MDIEVDHYIALKMSTVDENDEKSANIRLVAGTVRGELMAIASTWLTFSQDNQAVVIDSQSGQQLATNLNEKELKELKELEC